MRKVSLISDNILRPYVSIVSLVHPYRALLTPDGGFSYNPVHKTAPNQRYMVAEPGNEESHNISELGHEHILAHQNKINHLLQDPNTFQGGWSNPEDGRAYLDVSKQYPDIDTAMTAARKNSQLAIFDNQAGKSIPTQFQPGDQRHASMSNEYYRSIYSAMDDPRYA